MKPAAITILTGCIPVFAAMLLLSCGIDALPSTYQCVKDTDCSGGRVCQAGLCTEAASDCNSDTQCTEPQLCIDGLCTDPICNDDFCIPPFCRNNCDCNSDSWCFRGRCTILDDQCHEASDCSEGYGCNEQNPGDRCTRKRCEFIEIECTTPADCESSYTLCEQGKCINPRCFYAQTCQAGLTCRNYDCVPVECEQASDCSTTGNQTCFRGRCLQLYCDQGGHQACPWGTVCYYDICQALPCGEDIGCMSQTICRNGFCQVPECDSNADCLPVEACDAGQCMLTVPATPLRKRHAP